MLPNSLPTLNQPYLRFLIEVQGGYAVVIPVTALISVLLVLLLVFRGKEPFAGFAILLIAPLPFIVSLIGSLHSAIHTSFLIAESADPPANGMWLVFGISMVFVMIGLLHSLPGYAVAVVGLFLRVASRTKETPNETESLQELLSGGE